MRHSRVWGVRRLCTKRVREAGEKSIQIPNSLSGHDSRGCIMSIKKFPMYNFETNYEEELKCKQGKFFPNRIERRE